MSRVTTKARWTRHIPRALTLSTVLAALSALPPQEVSPPPKVRKLVWGNGESSLRRRGKVQHV